MAQVTHGNSGVEVESGDDRLGVAHRGFRPLPDEQSRFVVVGGEQRVGRVDGVERGVERDDDDARVASFLDGGYDGLRVAGYEQNALYARSDHVLDGGDLRFVVAVERTRGSLEFHAEFVGFGLRAFTHLDEKGVGLGFGDKADFDVLGETCAR